MPNSTSRLSLVEPLTSDAASELRTSITSNATTLDNAVVEFSGTLSNRSTVVPTPEIGFDYYATDTRQWSRYNGTLWRALGLAPASTSSSTTAGDGQAILVAGSSAVTITLPAHSSGQMVSVTNFSTGGTTVSGTLIQGVGLSSASSFPLGSVGAHAILLDDGTNWNLIAGQQDSGWQALTIVHGNHPSGYVPSARLQGDVVRLKGVVDATSSSGWATIPSSSMYPSITISQIPVANSGGFDALTVTTAGSMSTTSVGDVDLDGVSYTLS